MQNRKLIVIIALTLLISGMELGTYFSFSRGRVPGQDGTKAASSSESSGDLRKNPLIIGLSEDLKLLQLAGTSVTDDDLKQLSANIFKKVTAVILRSTKISDKGLAYLKVLPIEVLDLSETEVTGKGLRELKGIPIKRLLLRKTKVKDDDLKNLQSLPLEWIFLNHTETSDAGLELIKGLPLRAINLNGTKVTDAGLAKLKSMSLIRLDLEDTAISDVGLSFAGDFPELKILALGGSKVTEEGKKTLHAKRPEIRIIDRDSGENQAAATKP